MLGLRQPENKTVEFRAKAASDSDVPCVITEKVTDGEAFDGGSSVGGSVKKIITNISEGEHGLSAMPFDLIFTPILDAG